MQFKHSPLAKHPELVGSFCLLCGKLIAAGPNPEILKFLEHLHDCPSIRKQPDIKLRQAA